MTGRSWEVSPRPPDTSPAQGLGSPQWGAKLLVKKVGFFSNTTKPERTTLLSPFMPKYKLALSSFHPRSFPCVHRGPYPVLLCEPISRHPDVYARPLSSWHGARRGHLEGQGSTEGGVASGLRVHFKPPLSQLRGQFPPAFTPLPPLPRASLSRAHCGTVRRAPIPAQAAQTPRHSPCGTPAPYGPRCPEAPQGARGGGETRGEC